MPRRARLDAPGALQHIILRGIERRRVFYDDADRDDFLKRLGDLATESATACYAWVLMPNHVHLLLQTGRVPLAVLMQRLLTGYAVAFNRRHRRHGHVFQNRYKSILCEQEPYLLELVRYIHLNPLRGAVVPDLDRLDSYPYAGHSTLMGRRRVEWQATDAVLSRFGERVGAARRAYRAFVADGIPLGRRSELVGGGLIRSHGGWIAVKALRTDSVRLKGDERILGDSGFVLDVLKAAEERLARQEQLRQRGIDVDRLAKEAIHACGVDPGSFFAPNKSPASVAARSLFCYWAVRHLGMSATAVARLLGVTQPAVTAAMRRGEALARARGLHLAEASNL